MGPRTDTQGDATGGAQRGGHPAGQARQPAARRPLSRRHRQRDALAAVDAAAAHRRAPAQERVVVERIESAWLLVGREGISAHLLDVLENRIKRVDQVAMQNLIDVEQSWLLGKAPPPKRTGGGFQREAGGKLMHEAAWYHNLEVRHLALSQGAKGGAVPPPLSPGLRTGSSVGQSTAALWPDSARPPPWRG